MLGHGTSLTMLSLADNIIEDQGPRGPSGALWLSRLGGDGKKQSTGGETSMTKVSLGCRNG